MNKHIHLEVAIERVLRIISMADIIKAIKYELRFIRPDGKSKLIPAMVAYSNSDLVISLLSNSLKQTEYEYDLDIVAEDFHKTAIDHYSKSDIGMHAISHYESMYYAHPLNVLINDIKGSQLNYTKQQYVVFCIGTKPKYPSKLLSVVLAFATSNYPAACIYVKLSPDKKMFDLHFESFPKPFARVPLESKDVGSLVYNTAHNWVSSLS